MVVGQFVSVADITANKFQFIAAPGGSGLPYNTFTFQVEDNGGTAGGGIDMDPTPKTMTINVTPVDTTPPTVQAVTPISASTNVPTNSVVTVTFSEAMNVTTITPSTIQLHDSIGNLVAATVAYSAASNTATLTPTGPLANSTMYTLTVVGARVGLRTLRQTHCVQFLSSFSTIAAVPTTFSLWGSSSSPATIDSGDGQAVELGVKFRPAPAATSRAFDSSGQAIQAHTSATCGQFRSTTRDGHLHERRDQRLATSHFLDAVAIAAGATYVASYHTTSGHYAVNKSYFTSTFTNGPLQAAANGGVYAYGEGSFPTANYQASNYWVDVVFTTVPPADNTPPTVMTVSPAANSAECRDERVGDCGL